MEISNLLHALIDSDGPGGLVIVAVLVLACMIYYGLTRWIIAGGQTPSRGEKGAVPEASMSTKDGVE